MGWETGLACHRIDLALPLLIVEGRNGLLACGYIDVHTLNKTGEAGAIVTGVRNFEDMLEAEVVAVSDKAAEKGLVAGQKGRDVIEAIR